MSFELLEMMEKKQGVRIGPVKAAIVRKPNG
jgi:hypothetical protein